MRDLFVNRGSVLYSATGCEGFPLRPSGIFEIYNFGAHSASRWVKMLQAGRDPCYRFRPVLET